MLDTKTSTYCLPVLHPHARSTGAATPLDARERSFERRSRIVRRQKRSWSAPGTWGSRAGRRSDPAAGLSKNPGATAVARDRSGRRALRSIVRDRVEASVGSLRILRSEEHTSELQSLAYL